MRKNVSTENRRNLSASDVSLVLRSAFDNWLSILRQPREADADKQRFRETIATSIRFTRKNIDDLHRAHQFHICLARGRALLETALEWQEPSVGNASSDTSGVRGLQWREVIAWSGLEQILNCLISSPGSDDVDRLVAELQLPEYRELPPPDHKLCQLRNWRERDDGDDATGVNGFLQAQSKMTKQVFRSWLIDGKPISTWTQGLMLAKSLRHVSAHGALSASKIRQWGLAPVLERLVPEMGIVATAVLKRMIDECRRVYGDELCEPVVKHELALTLSPAEAEAVLRSQAATILRKRQSKTFGRIYVYASRGRRTEDEAAVLRQYGIEDVTPNSLKRDRVRGTVELYACTPEGSDYIWHFRNPKKLHRDRLPEGRVSGVWFVPFKTNNKKR